MARDDTTYRHLRAPCKFFILFVPAVPVSSQQVAVQMACAETKWAGGFWGEGEGERAKLIHPTAYLYETTKEPMGGRGGRDERMWALG